MFWMENDERVRAYSAYEAFGYEYAAASFDKRIAAATDTDKGYWLRVRAALDMVAE